MVFLMLCPKRYAMLLHRLLIGEIDPNVDKATLKTKANLQTLTEVHIIARIK